MHEKPRNRDWVKNAAIIFLAVLLVLTFFSNTIMNRSLPEVATQEVTDGSIVARVRGTGTVTANTNSQVKMEKTRVVRSVLVKVGQEVQAGDVLFTLGEGSSEDIESAEENLRNLQANYNRTAVSVPEHNYTTDYRKLDNLSRDLENARKELAVAEQAAKANAIDPETIDKIEKELERAIAKRDAAQADYYAALGWSMNEGLPSEQYHATYNVQHYVNQGLNGLEKILNGSDADNISVLDLENIQTAILRILVEDEDIDGDLLDDDSYSDRSKIDTQIMRLESLLKTASSTTTEESEEEEGTAQSDVKNAGLLTASELAELLAQESTSEMDPTPSQEIQVTQTQENETAPVTAEVDAPAPEEIVPIPVEEPVSSSEEEMTPIPAEEIIPVVVEENVPIVEDTTVVTEETVTETTVDEQVVSDAAMFESVQPSALFDEPVVDALTEEELVEASKMEVVGEVSIETIQEEIAIETLQEETASTEEEPKSPKTGELTEEEINDRIELLEKALKLYDRAESLKYLRQQLVNQTKAAYDATEAEAQKWATALQTVLDTGTAEGAVYKSKLEQFNYAEDAYLTALETLNDKQAADQRTDAGYYVDLSNTMQEIERAKQKLAELTGGEEAQVLAKVSGTIQSIEVSPGETKQKDDILATIEVPDLGYSLSFSVTNDQANRLRPGDTATVSNFYWGTEIVATLNSIKVDPKNPQTNKILTFDLKGNVTAGSELTISVGQKSANYDTIIPSSSIRTDSNGSFVLKVEARNSPLGNRYIARRVPVEVLASDDSSSAVTADLGYGDYVITTSSAPIKNGELVRLATS